MSQKETAAEGIERVKAEAARLIEQSRRETEEIFTLTLAGALIDAESRGFHAGLAAMVTAMGAKS